MGCRQDRDNLSGYGTNIYVMHEKVQTGQHLSLGCRSSSKEGAFGVGDGTSGF